MTYDANETSIESGRPVEVYKIVAGAQSFFFTSSESDEILGATTYEAIEGLERSSITEGPDTREDDFSIDLPTTNPLSQLFTGVLPGFRVSLTVMRYHRDDLPTPEVVQVFDGFVQSAAFLKQGKITRLTARTELAAIGKQAPRRTYQSACNHILYEPVTCKVDDTDPAFRASTLSVASQVSNILTVSSGLSGTYPDGFMNGGFVEILGGADFRLILGHTGNTLDLLLAFSATPSQVNVFAGCSHSIQVCGSKFANVGNFGGFAFVPSRNPFQGGVV